MRTVSSKVVLLVEFHKILYKMKSTMDFKDPAAVPLNVMCSSSWKKLTNLPTFIIN